MFQFEIILFQHGMLSQISRVRPTFHTLYAVQNKKRKIQEGTKDWKEHSRALNNQFTERETSEFDCCTKDMSRRGLRIARAVTMPHRVKAFKYYYLQMDSYKSW